MTNIADVAIVGGGASGIYAAWRLAHANGAELQAIRTKIGGSGRLKVRLYEMSDRIGGRLLSASPKRLPQVAMELGGMRYMDDHTLVKSLVENKLKLKTHEQYVDEPNNLAWLRRRLFRQSELGLRGVELPFTLTESERIFLNTPKDDGSYRSPADLIFWAVFKQFPELRGMDPEDIRPWLEQHARVDDRPLHQVGFWNLLARHLSNEARTLALKTVGYDSLGANANAVDIIAENLDFTVGSKYHLLQDGFEAMLWELEDEFTAAGGEIVLREELESFDSVWIEGEGRLIDLEFQSGLGARSRAIVLAMPQWAIRNLRKIGPVLDPDHAPSFQRLLNSVTGVPLYKLFVIYDRPWWNDNDPLLERGRSVTDLPVRQCYYWHTDPGGGASAIMAYNDEASVSFWGGYQSGLGTSESSEDSATPGPVLFQPANDSDAAVADFIVQRRLKNWREHQAPEEMVEEMHRQLMEIHQVQDAPKPVDAAFMDWMNPPYGGAVHFWNPGAKSWEVRTRMIQPVEGVPAYVIGESWSTVQAWAEGAFQTAELFLQGLGMEKPAWVPRGARVR